MARAKTRPHTFRAIAWLFARLAIASFYVRAIKGGIPFQIPEFWSAIKDEISALLKTVKS